MFIAKPSFPILNRAAPLSDVKYSWHFGDGGGTKVNEGTTGLYPGTLNAGCSWDGSAWGHGVLFDGSTGVVDTTLDSQLDFERTDPFSVSALVYATGNGDIVCKLGANPFPGFTLFVLSGTIGFYILNDYLASTGRIWCVTTGTYLNAWHLITATYDGSSTNAGLNIYIDGVLVGQNRTQGPIIFSMLNNESLKLGNRVSNGYPFNGSIAGVHIWDRELSNNEVSLLNQDPFIMYRRTGIGWLGGILTAGGGGYLINSGLVHNGLFNGRLVA